MDDFIKELLDKEGESIIKVMAFMSYNPSIGRVLQKGGVKIFQRMVMDKIEKIKLINSISVFDSFHDKWINEFKNKIKTNKKKRCSYGQAQKAINVFLKLYIDWAKRPKLKIAKKLLPFLHVPLDSILMKEIKGKFLYYYKTNIIRQFLSEKQPYSLSKIDKKAYLKWQVFFREQFPKKPLIFDIAWAINR